MTSSGLSLTERARKRTSGCDVSTSRDDARTATAGHVHIDQHDVGIAFADHLDGRVDVGGGTDHVDVVVQLGAHPREEQLMVVDEEHARSCRRAPSRQ